MTAKKRGAVTLCVPNSGSLHPETLEEWTARVAELAATSSRLETEYKALRRAQHQTELSSPKWCCGSLFTGAPKKASVFWLVFLKSVPSEQTHKGTRFAHKMSGLLVRNWWLVEFMAANWGISFSTRQSVFLTGVGRERQRGRVQTGWGVDKHVPSRGHLLQLFGCNGIFWYHKGIFWYHKA